ncbi:23778_t:CDS:1, partial [Cetraspora pellucida]
GRTKFTLNNLNDDLKEILNDEKYHRLWIPYNEFKNIKDADWSRNFFIKSKTDLKSLNKINYEE